MKILSFLIEQVKNFFLINHFILEKIIEHPEKIKIAPKWNSKARVIENNSSSNSYERLFGEKKNKFLSNQLRMDNIVKNEKKGRDWDIISWKC